MTPRALARRAERRQRLAAARDQLAAEDKARRGAQRAKQQAWDAAAAAGKRRGGRRPGDEPRANRAGTEPRANITGPDVRVMRNQKGYVPGCNGQLVVTAQQVIVGAMLSQHPVDRTLLHPLLDQCRGQLAAAGIRPKLRKTPAAGPTGQRPRPGRRAPAQESQAPGGVSGHRPRHPADATSPRTRRLQAAGPHRGTSLRATQDLPETDHDVPARPGRLRKRMAAGLYRTQPAKAAPAPHRGMTVKGRSPRPRPKIARNHNSHPVSHSRIPDLALHEGFVRQPELCKESRDRKAPAVLSSGLSCVQGHDGTP